MKIEIWGLSDSTSMWHVLADGDTVGYITQVRYGWNRGTWKFEWGLEAPNSVTPDQLPEIKAAAAEKTSSLNLLLSITKRLTS